MKTTLEKPTVAADGNAIFATLSREPLMRRDFLAGAAAIGATFVLPRELAAAAAGKKTFTILHTNDMHSSFHRDGPGFGLHPVHAQRRHDPGRICAPGRFDREAEGGA